MAITVKDTSKEYKLSIKHEGEEVVFTYSPLTYRQKSLISSLTTTFQNGEMLGDQALTAFYVIKFGVKSVKGIVDEDGKPYKVEPENNELPDQVVEDLLAADFSSPLMLAAANLMAGLPDTIINPLTGLPLDGVEFKPIKKGSSVKKSKASQ